jgi:hypothetical protein
VKVNQVFNVCVLVENINFILTQTAHPVGDLQSSRQGPLAEDQGSEGQGTEDSQNLHQPTDHHRFRQGRLHGRYARSDVSCCFRCSTVLAIFCYPIVWAKQLFHNRNCITQLF